MAITVSRNVKAEAREKKQETHFGQVLAFLFLKNAQLRKALQGWKGRLVFRGDDVRDQHGNMDVFF